MSVSLLAEETSLPQRMYLLLVQPILFTCEIWSGDYPSKQLRLLSQMPKEWRKSPKVVFTQEQARHTPSTSSLALVDLAVEEW
jgi:hypothetical protein